MGGKQILVADLLQQYVAHLASFCISGNTFDTIVFKFGMLGWPVTKYVLTHKSWVAVGKLCTCARAPPSPISVSQDPINQFMLKFDVWLETQ